MSMRSPQGARLARIVGHEGSRSGSIEHTLSERGGHTRGVLPWSSNHSKPAWKSMLPRPLIAISSVRSSEDVDAVRANLGRGLAQRAPEFGDGRARQRARSVHDDRDRGNAMRMDGEELGRSRAEGAHHVRGDGAWHLAVTEPDAVGDAAREQPRLVKRLAEPLGGVAKSRRYATHNLFVLTGACTSSVDRPRSRHRRGRPGV